jgi:hypothetical protein
MALMICCITPGAMLVAYRCAGQWRRRYATSCLLPAM